MCICAVFFMIEECVNDLHSIFNAKINQQIPLLGFLIKFLFYSWYGIVADACIKITQNYVC